MSNFYFQKCKNEKLRKKNCLVGNLLLFLSQTALHHGVGVEEVVDEGLLRGGGAVHHLHGHGSPLVLVVGQAIRRPVEVVGAAVQSLQHVGGLGHSTAVSVHLLGALEEDHVTSEDLHDGVLVQGGLGEGPGDVVAVVVSVNQHLSPDWVLGSQGLGHVDVLPEVLSEHLQVDLVVSVEHVHLGEDAGQVAHLGGHAIFEVGEIAQELSKVLLSDLNEAISLPLVPLEVAEEDALQGVRVDGWPLGELKRVIFNHLQ